MTIDGRRARGNRTRDQVLAVAVGLATERGIDGFSLGELAAESGVSKAGMMAVFGAKAQLQQAIIDRAQEVLTARVFLPVAEAPDGLRRLERLGEVWLNYLNDPDLRGGCFFAATLFELDSRPGPLQAILHPSVEGWLTAIAAMVEHGQANGEIDPMVVAGDEALDLFTLGVTTNALIQLGSSTEPAARARRVWASHMERIRCNSADEQGQTR